MTDTDKEAARVARLVRLPAILICLFLLSSIVFAAKDITATPSQIKNGKLYKSLSLIDGSGFSDEKLGANTYRIYSDQTKAEVVLDFAFKNKVTQNNLITDCDLLTCDMKIEITPRGKNIKFNSSLITGGLAYGNAQVEKIFFYQNQTYVSEYRPVWAVRTINDGNATWNETYQSGVEQVFGVRQIEQTDLSQLYIDDGQPQTIIIRFKKTTPEMNVDIYPTMFNKSYTEWAWWNATWTLKYPITFYYNQSIPTAQSYLIGFVSVNTSDAVYYNQTTGTNIRFLDSTESVLLNYKLMSNNTTFLGNSTNNATYAVALNMSALLNNTTVYLYVGNPTAASGENLIGAVSGSFCNQTGLHAFWTFGEGAGTTASEVCNGRTGTLDNATFNATGKYGYGIITGVGSPAGKMTFTATNDTTNTYTLMSWVQRPATLGKISVLWFGGSNYNFYMESSNAPSIFPPLSQAALPISQLDAVQSQFMVLACDGTGAGASKFYFNGTPDANAVTCNALTSANLLSAGGGQSWDGALLNAPMVFNDTKSADYVKASYSLHAIVGDAILGNNAPNITYINITPTSAYASTTLLCNVTVMDNEAALINVSYYWFLNGTNQTTLAGSINVSNNTNTNIANLSSGNLTQGDNWSCYAKAFDGTLYSAVYGSSNITIAGSASISSVVMNTNGTSYQLGPLYFNVTAQSMVSPTLTLYYSWYKNGTNQTAMAGTAALTNNTLLQMNATAGGPYNPTDYWNVSVFATDINGASAAVQSNNTTIGSYFTNIIISNAAAFSNMNFTSTLNFTLSGAASATAYFIFNISNSSGTNGGVAPAYSFVSSQAPPFVTTTTTFYGNWFYTATLSNGSTYTTNNTTSVVVNPYMVLACGGVSNTSTVVYNFIDGQNGSAINATLSTILYQQTGGRSNTTQIAQTNTTQTYCISPIDAVINITDTETISAAGYSSQTVYRTYTANNTTQTFNIYLYSTASAYAVQLLTQQYPTIPLSGINISIYHYTAPSNYTLYQSCTSGTAGTCLVYLIPNTAYYLFNFTYQGVAYSFGPETIVCNPASSLCYRTFTILQTTLPPYIVGGMTGSCNYSNTTYTTLCEGNDPSATITSYNISTFYLSNGSQICTNKTNGASALISCTVPTTNGTYTFRFTGSDGTNIYVLSYGTINVGGTAASLFGRDGWLAMLFLFVIISLAGIYSPILSVVLGSVALLGGGLIGFVPMGGIMAVVIVLAVLAGFLAYRMRF